MLFHKHRLVPGHMGGTYESSNVIRVNVAMHAFLHKILYEQHGRWQDEVAARMLTGLISKQNHWRQIVCDMNVNRWATDTSYRAMMSARMKGNTQGLGYKHAPDHLAKLSRKMKGNTLSKGMRFTRTPEMIAARIGRKHTPETIAKLTGRVFSDEHRTKISRAAQRRPRRKQSAETCAKMSAGLKGLKRSPESVARIRAAALAREQRKRDARVH